MSLGTMYLIFLFVIITFRLCLHLLRLPHVSKCYSTQVEPVKQNIMKTFSAQEFQISSGDPGGDPDDFLSAFTDFSSTDWSFLDSVDMVAEAKKPCPTLRKVPPKHTRKIASVLASVAHLALHPSTAIARERALKYWFLLPRLLFQAPLRNRRTGRNAKSMYAARTLLVGERLAANARERFFEYQASLLSLEFATVNACRRAVRISKVI